MAKPMKRKRKPNSWEYCDHCDGCGWSEGGRGKIGELCKKCKGKGIVPVVKE